MPPKKTAKKTAVPIPKAGAISVDPAAALKLALEAKFAQASSSAAVPDAVPDEVDARMPNHKNYRVHTNNGKSYSTYLMKADLLRNNNKFYVCQVVDQISDSSVHFWTRYGRVGDLGVSELCPAVADKAEKDFVKTVRSKSTKGKGYAEIKMNLGEKKEEKNEEKEEEKEEKKEKPAEPKDFAPSKLDAQVQDFVKLIFNKTLMEQAVAANGFDVKKLPLGDLSQETIQKGYLVLSEIEKAIENKQTAALWNLCSKFYTYIPHNFGRQKMSSFIIDTDEKLKNKQELIQKLVGINAANDAIKSKPVAVAVTADLKPNPVDLNYERLNCNMSAV